MAHKTRNPGAGRRQGFDQELVLQAGSEVGYSPLHAPRQVPLAVRRLALRFGMTPSTAALVVELAGIGGAR